MITKAELTLAKSLGKQKIPPHNTEALKVCFYEGLYRGYIAGLESEYAECAAPIELGIVSVVRAALSVFAAMHDWLDVVNDSEIDQVFDGVYVTDESDSIWCDSYSRADADSDQGIDEFVKSVCWND